MEVLWYFYLIAAILLMLQVAGLWLHRQRVPRTLKPLTIFLLVLPCAMLVLTTVRMYFLDSGNITGRLLALLPLVVSLLVAWLTVRHRFDR